MATRSLSGFGKQVDGVEGVVGHGREQSALPAGRTSFSERFLRHDPSSVVRALTDTLVGIWPHGTQPRSAKVASKRAKVMNGQADPIGYAYPMVLAAIDEGKTVEEATRWATDLIASAAQYAERHRPTPADVLPFPVRALRLSERGEREQCDAEITKGRVLAAGSLEDLMKARKEALEEIAVDEEWVMCLTTEIAYRRSKGEA